MTVGTEELLLAQEGQAEEIILRILQGRRGPLSLDELLADDDLAKLPSIAVRRALWALASDRRITFTRDWRIELPAMTATAS